MDDLLLLRLPPREATQKGPPPSAPKALQKFDGRTAAETRKIEAFALEQQWILMAARGRWRALAP
eukprot:4883255-Pyramimonas_sp.AAC.1